MKWVAKLSEDAQCVIIMVVGLILAVLAGTLIDMMRTELASGLIKISAIALVKVIAIVAVAGLAFVATEIARRRDLLAERLAHGAETTIVAIGVIICLVVLVGGVRRCHYHRLGCAITASARTDFENVVMIRKGMVSQADLEPFVKERNERLAAAGLAIKPGGVWRGGWTDGAPVMTLTCVYQPSGDWWPKWL